MQNSMTSLCRFYALRQHREMKIDYQFHSSEVFSIYTVFHREYMYVKTFPITIILKMCPPFDSSGLRPLQTLLTDLSSVITFMRRELDGRGL
jgi:hypothetical protein